ncbi:hypothetical protein KZ770_11445 [Escherichia coli]|nr:hypothetical protein [Escherichia coli]
MWWPVLISGLTAIGVGGTPRFIAAGVRTDYSTSFRTCSAMGDTFTRPRTALARLISASACAFTTTLRALPSQASIGRDATPPAMLSSLYPRLFRGVTPDRHDGESSCRAYR